MKDLLFLAHRVPYPPDRGDKIRSYHVLCHLAARARVHLVAFADVPEDETPHPRLAELTTTCTIVPRRKGRIRATLEALASGRPASLAAFADPAMRRAVDGVLARGVDAIYCFSGQMAQYLPAEPSAAMDFVDVDSAKFEALAETAPLPLRALYRREARLLAADERDVSARVDASVFVTEAEATLFRQRGGARRVLVVENGIDAHHFDPQARFAPLAEAGPLVVFTGQMDYRPNIDAAQWFAREVLPQVSCRHPAARFAIVGRAPAPPVLALARVPGVLVTGTVPDVRPWLAAASVCVAPLRVARGLQNKVLEAMAMARPTVVSRAAAEGIDHGGTVTVAPDAAAFAREVVHVLDDPIAANQLAAAARPRVLSRYAWDARLASLDPLLGIERRLGAAA